MRELLNEMELALTDVMQSGLATWGDSGRFANLAESCEAHGLHTGAALMKKTAELIKSRAHGLEKDDMPLASVICRAVRYIALCREKSQEDEILARWADEGGTL